MGLWGVCAVYCWAGRALKGLHPLLRCADDEKEDEPSKDGHEEAPPELRSDEVVHVSFDPGFQGAAVLDTK